jgi:hypothetical protein
VKSRLDDLQRVLPERLGLDQTLASPDRLRVDILPSDTPPFVNSLNKVSAWPGARCAVVIRGISHDFGTQNINGSRDLATRDSNG